MNYRVIHWWQDGHQTLISWNTRGRRSKRTRRVWRAARRGNLGKAWVIMTNGHHLYPLTSCE